MKCVSARASTSSICSFKPDPSPKHEPSVQVELVGSAVLRLVAHREDYFMQLPNLLLDDPLSATACQPSITGVGNHHVSGQ